MTEDWRLLKTYARDRSQQAFAQIVAKYADFTYHTALRRTRSHQLAEDVTQAVFIALARSASQLKPGGSLGGWIHKTTLFASGNALRAELRRKRRERAAADVSDSTIVVEEELHNLPKSDRQLLSLHYLEGQTMNQIATTLGVPLDTAHKRRTRALQRLRELLAARGMLASAASICTTLASITATTTQVSSAQLAATAVAGGQSGNAFALAREVIWSMRLGILRHAATAVLGIAFVGGVAALLLRPPSSSPPPTDPAPTPVLFAQLPPPTPIPEVAPGPAVKLPEEIRKALTQNAEQVGPISIAFTMQSSSTLTMEQAMEILHLDQYWASLNSHARYEYRLSYQDRKYYSWFHHDEWPGLPENWGKESTIESAFDGKTLYMADVRPPADDPTVAPQGTTLLRHKVDALPPKLQKMESGKFCNGTDYFDEIALRLPVTFADLRDKRPATSQILRLLERGGALTAIDQVVLDDRNLVRLRIVTDDPDRKIAVNADLEMAFASWREISVESDESLRAKVESLRRARDLPKHRHYLFYLDPDLNYAVRRCEERYDDGKEGVLITRTDCDDFKALADRSLHLPRRVVVSEYSSTSVRGTFFPGPVVSRLYEVSELKLEPIPRRGSRSVTPRLAQKSSTSSMQKARARSLPSVRTGRNGSVELCDKFR